MPISRAMARRLTPAVPSAAICALATVLISFTVAWRTRSRRGSRGAVSVMLTAYGRVNSVNNSEAWCRRERTMATDAGWGAGPDRGDLHVVVGASGATGGALVRELARRGRRVRAVNRGGDAAVPEGVERLAADVGTARRPQAGPPAAGR